MMARSEEAHKRMRTVERPSAPPPRLVVLTGADTGTEVLLDRPVVTVGRSRACDLVLGGRRVSGRHARLEVSGGQVVLADGGSTNGTWIDGERLSDPLVLADGDVISFADVAVRFDAGRNSAEVVPAGQLPLPEPEPAAEPPSPTLPTSAPLVPLVPLPVVAPPLPETVQSAPHRRKRTVLISHAPPDRAVADLLFELLQRAGHLVWVDYSADGQGWRGRLLDTMWTCDLVIWLVSPAVADSEGVRREVHLAGSERTPVLPVLLAPTELPPHLAYYLSVRPPIDLHGDPDSALRELLDAVEATARKRIARPRRLATLLAASVVLVGLVAAAAHFVLG